MLHAETVLQSATTLLRQSSDSARLDAELLLSHVLQCPRSAFYRNDPIAEHALGPFYALLERRAQGEPIAYLIGHQEFYEDRFRVNPAVLIPRPETETLIQQVVNTPSHPTNAFLDLGCGSGCVGLSLAKLYPHAQVDLVDLSPEALDVAKLNAKELKLSNVRFFESAWFNDLPTPSRYDWIVSNPPYLMDNDPRAEQAVLAYEPTLALVSGADGLNAIRDIIQNASAHLNRPGQLWLEHGVDQASSVRQLLLSQGFSEVASVRDLAGIERISGGVLR